MTASFRCWLRMLLSALLLALAVLQAGPAAAATDPNDADGTADHPEVPRFPGFHIDAATRNDYNEFVFATQGFDAWADGKGDARAGRFWEIRYVLNEGARTPSLVELIANYENALRKAGGRLVRKDPQQGAVFRVPRRDGGERWVQLDIYAANTGYTLDIVDVGAMAQKLELDAGEMADLLRQQGRVALQGILFDTGKATIRAESEALLAEVLALLQREPSLRLRIEGHTDKVGDRAANLALSARRAQAVLQHLVAHGIEARRLSAVGKGDSVPRAANDSEAGRAANRRVELVKS
ncbi:OmpA family protein [Aquabacterium sp.]|uniref:OmpA family protein n=1 Tax=Aquabacterium sp. TaxID=1872578 RepID=UPI0037842290